MATPEKGVSFTDEETEALRDIVAAWVDEQFVLPPYPPAVNAVLRKLGLARQD